MYFIWICSPLVRVVRSEGVRTIYNGSQMPPLLPQLESAILEALTQEYWQQARNYFEINYDGLWSDSDRAKIWNTIQSFIELGLRWGGQKSRWGSYVCDWLSGHGIRLRGLGWPRYLCWERLAPLTGSIINPVHVCLTLTDSFSFLLPPLSASSQRNKEHSKY